MREIKVEMASEVIEPKAIEPKMNKQLESTVESLTGAIQDYLRHLAMEAASHRAPGRMDDDHHSEPWVSETPPMPASRHATCEMKSKEE